MLIQTGRFAAHRFLFMQGQGIPTPGAAVAVSPRGSGGETAGVAENFFYKRGFGEEPGGFGKFL
jgi:hypothetical protein